MRVFAILTWCASPLLFKIFHGKMVVRTAMCFKDLCDRKLCLEQILFDIIDTDRIDIICDRTIHVFLKKACKIIGMVGKVIGNCGSRDCIPVVFVNIIHDIFHAMEHFCLMSVFRRLDLLGIGMY